MLIAGEFQEPKRSRLAQGGWCPPAHCLAKAAAREAQSWDCTDHGAAPRRPGR
jgi:hypothetical protein